MYKLDHITVVAHSLRDGVNYVEEKIGVTAPKGGQHLTMGTHNHLLKLGDELFLEIIAVNPEALRPNRPRWFGLDSLNGRIPRLATWIIATPEIKEDIAAKQDLLGCAVKVMRNDLTWLISIRNDGLLPLNGAFPSLIEWHSPHPTINMEESDCNLISLTVKHPKADLVRSFLDKRLKDEKVKVISSKEQCLRAEILTPRGLFVLD